ncbi:MAG: hypothetical protein EPN25_01075 [Nitrospirae bacterium]|nr:MAG: hypothetical protein EPN25_01075 [Nitrospirota bacterium]
MDQAIAVFIMINNHCHDVATATLLSSGLVMWSLVHHYEKSGSGSGRQKIGLFLLSIHNSMRVIVLASLAWITLSSIPRILSFTRFEWRFAVENGHIVGLIAKHTLAFVVLVCGTLLWIRLNRKIKAIPSPAPRQNSQTV